MTADILEKQDALHDTENQYVTFFIDKQMFCIPVMLVRDIFQADKITHIPQAPKVIYGAINLRGHIITAIDLRERLKIPATRDVKDPMNIAVEVDGETYSIVVDSVGEVLTLAENDFEKNPATLDEKWKEVSSAVYKLDKRLLIVLDMDRVLDIFG